jgi:hypothetical protein
MCQPEIRPQGRKSAYFYVVMALSRRALIEVDALYLCSCTYVSACRNASSQTRCRPGQASTASADPGPIATGQSFANAGAPASSNNSILWLWVPAFAGTTAEQASISSASAPAGPSGRYCHRPCAAYRWRSLRSETSPQTQGRADDWAAPLRPSPFA